MSPLGWALIQLDCCLHQKGDEESQRGTTHVHREMAVHRGRRGLLSASLGERSRRKPTLLAPDLGCPASRAMHKCPQSAKCVMAARAKIAVYPRFPKMTVEPGSPDSQF